MCVAALAWNAHPRWRLVAAGNRDEYHERPSAPLSRWEDGSGVIAGRDLRAGGTWLAVSEQGRFALVTNFRVPGYPKPDRTSRGSLVTDWLGNGELPAIDCMNPFNLFIADTQAAAFVTNHPACDRRALAPGVHGLSNGPHDAPWPKTTQLCATLGQWLADDTDYFDTLFAALRREAPEPPDHWKPGHPEPRFAPMFIRNTVYGTRCSTVIAIDIEGAGTIIERSYDPEGRATGEVLLTFRWPA